MKVFKAYFQDSAAKADETPGEEMKVKKKPNMRLKSLDHLMPEKREKSKKKTTSFSEEINKENRKNEDDDETSDSSDSSSDSDSDEDAAIKKSSRLDIVVKEEDFEENEILTFTADVYNFTICANMTKCCSPLQQGFALKQCFIVFSVQILVPLFFIIDNIGDWKQPKMDSGAIRLICSLLLHIMIYNEVK